jgi:replicative DNA helicase
MPEQQPSPGRGPNTLGLERQLLGAYILGAPIDNSVTGAVFYQSAHKLIFSAIKALKAAGLAVDTALVRGELERRGNLADAGGTAAVESLAAGTSPVNSGYYEKAVLDDYRRRKLSDLSADTAKALEDGAEPDIVTAALTGALAAITEPARKGFRFERIGGTELCAPEYLVKDFFEAGAFGSLFGTAKRVNRS